MTDSDNRLPSATGSAVLGTRRGDMLGGSKVLVIQNEAEYRGMAAE